MIYSFVLCTSYYLNWLADTITHYTYSQLIIIVSNFYLPRVIGICSILQTCSYIKFVCVFILFLQFAKHKLQWDVKCSKHPIILKKYELSWILQLLFFLSTIRWVLHLNKIELEKIVFPRFIGQMTISRISPRINSISSCLYVYVD